MTLNSISNIPSWEEATLKNISSKKYKAPLAFETVENLLKYIAREGIGCDQIIQHKTDPWYNTFQLVIKISILAQRYINFDRTKVKNAITACLIDLMIQEFDIHNVFTRKEIRPLHEAASKNSPLVCNALVKLGVSVEEPINNTLKMTALHVACLMNRKESVRELLELGADPNAIEPESSQPPLVMGACHNKIISLLCEKGADIENQGKEALEKAAFKGKFKAVKKLLLQDTHLDVNSFLNLTSKLIDQVFINMEKARIKGQTEKAKIFTRINNLVKTYKVLCDRFVNSEST